MSFKIVDIQIKMGSKMIVHFDQVMAKVRGFISFLGGNHECLNMYFLSGDSQVPPPSFEEKDKAVSLFLPFDEMQSFLTLIHLERELHCFVDPVQPEMSCLTTSI